jgi:hypothetical protein
MEIREQATSAEAGDLSWVERYASHCADREDSVHEDLSRRLRPVCENLSTADFEALVVDMTREQLRGEGNPGRGPRPA